MTANVVNLQPLGTQILVPRPFGLRVSGAEAIAILSKGGGLRWPEDELKIRITDAMKMLRVSADKNTKPRVFNTVFRVTAKEVMELNPGCFTEATQPVTKEKCTLILSKDSVDVFEAYGILEDRRAVPGLLRVLAEVSETEIVRMIVFALGEIGDPAAVSALRETAVAFNSELVQIVVRRALARLGAG